MIGCYRVCVQELKFIEGSFNQDYIIGEVGKHVFGNQKN